MVETKAFVRADFDNLLNSFLDENQFPWLDPTIHQRELICHDIDINRLFTIEALTDEFDLVADRNLRNGDILGLEETSIVGKAVLNLNIDEDLPQNPNELIQFAAVSCPCLSASSNDAAPEDLETIINRTSNDDFSSNSSLLTRLSTDEDFGLTNLTSTSQSFSCDFDNKISDYLNQWQNDFDQILISGSMKDHRSSEFSKNISKKLEISGIFEIPLFESNFSISQQEKSNRDAEKQLNRSYAIELNPNEKLGDFRLRVPQMAIEYPFELDTFQKQAILRLENNESVFVAAHTSAGKTVVAEYAIALAQSHGTKAFYTSPIKALSNQKYCDFKKRFDDVGLLTGDVQMNHGASCLIMTTEILRSMLYHRSNSLKSLEWVIMDEIHYLNDAERGFVWEEVLIMLPDHVGLIMLSATVSNAREFAEWVGRMKKRNVFVISTSKRPVPLEHFLYTGNSTSTNKELFMIIDAENKFLNRNYDLSVAAKAARHKDHQHNFGSRARSDYLNPNQSKTLLTSTIYMLRDKQLLPVVCFVFSRKRCDEYLDLVKGMDLNSQEDKHHVSQFFRQALSRLSDSDRNLPQVMNIEEMAKRGIAIHHSGVLPILRESVELLFQTGRIKVLFATETFAMGINMPARTVLFDSLQKHDGRSFRELIPSEYVQMAGRAGRRGLDKTGTVVALCKGDVPSISSLKSMILGKSAQLQSQFRLTYSMILNFLRVAECPLSFMVSSSYSEFHSQKANARDIIAASKLRSTVEALKNSMRNRESTETKKFFEICRNFFRIFNEFHKIFLETDRRSGRFFDDLLKTGRIVRIRNLCEFDVPAMVVDGALGKAQKRTISVLVATRDQKEKISDIDRLILKENPKLFVLPLRKPKTDEKKFYQIQNVSFEQIFDVTEKIVPNVKMENLLEDFFFSHSEDRFQIDLDSTAGQNKNLRKTIEQFDEIVKKLDEQNVVSNRLEILQNFLEKSAAEQVLEDFRKITDQIEKENFQNFQNLDEDFEKLRKFYFYEEKLKDFNQRISSVQNSFQMSADYDSMIEILKQLDYISKRENVLRLKGQVASIFGSGKELLLTELIYQNLIDRLNPSEIAALLSAIVFQGKRYDDQSLNDERRKEMTPTLEQAKHQLISIAQRLDQIQREHSVASNVEEELNFSIMSLIYKWANGAKFSEIISDPDLESIDLQEGTLVRTIMRIEDLCSDVRSAAKTVGNSELFDKLNQVTSLIKRGIVFAPSLYFSETITNL